MVLHNTYLIALLPVRHSMVAGHLLEEGPGGVVGAKLTATAGSKGSSHESYKILTPIPKLVASVGTVTVEWEEGRVL